MTSQAMTTSPSETIAPARVPGTDKFPKVPGDAGRSLSVFRGNKSHLISRTIVADNYSQNCCRSMVTFASFLLPGNRADFPCLFSANRRAEREI